MVYCNTLIYCDRCLLGFSKKIIISDRRAPKFDVTIRDQRVENQFYFVFIFSSFQTELLHTDRHIFQKKRLIRCIQKAVNRLYDPSEGTDNRKATRISYVAHLLSNSQYTGMKYIA